MLIPSPIPRSGFAVPIRAAFLVLKGLPLLSVASNNMNPRMTLFEDHMEYRVLKLTARSFRDIAMIDARRALGGSNLIVHWQAVWFSFSASVQDVVALAALLQFFRGKQLVLSDAAQEILARSDG